MSEIPSGNDLCNVAQSEVDLQKKDHHLSSISTPSPLLGQIEFCCFTKWSYLQIKKNLYLSSVDCDQGFKRLFEDDTLQYCRNSLRILESSCGPQAACVFDTPALHNTI